MKKLISLATALLMCTLLLAGCGDSGSSTPAPVDSPSEAPVENTNEDEGSVSGSISISVWDLDTQMAYVKTVVDQFTAANPGIDVEIIDLPSDSYEDKMAIDLNGGAAADVLLIKNANDLYNWSQKGQIADLSSFVAADGMDLSRFNGLAETLNINGMQTGLPIREDYYILYYNTDIFDAAEVDYPSNDMTWAEFEELAAQLTSGSGPDKIYGAHFHTWQALVQNWAVQDGKNTVMGPEYGFMTEAYEMALRLQDGGYMQDFATLSTGGIHYSGAFESGTVAMMPMGSWFMSTLINDKNSGETDVNWAVATIPHFDGVPAGYTIGSSTPIAVNEACENKEAAWELVKFFVGDEGAKILADAGQFPGILNADLLSTITAQDGMPEGALDALQVTNISLDRPIVEGINEVNEALGDVHELMMIGSMSIEDGLAELEERSKEIQGL